MAKFTIETKIQAATDYLTGQGSYKELARRYGVNHQVLQHWIGIYRPHGEVELRQLELYFYIAGVKSYG